MGTGLSKRDGKGKILDNIMKFAIVMNIRAVANYIYI